MLRDIDSLYTTAGHPVDFIKDISKKMQVPHRISFGPMELERPSSCSTNPESDMRVPDHILITEPIETKDAPALPELTADLDLVPIDRRLSLPPIPSTLALDEVSYPDLDRLLMEREQRPSSSPIHPLPEFTSPSGESKLLKIPPQSNPTEQINNSACTIVPAHSEKRLRALERRIVQLEHEHVRHKQLEHLGLAMIGILLVFKILRALF